MFIPHTDEEREQMLQSIGVATMEDLFEDVPEMVRFPQLNLPPRLTEMESAALLQELSRANEGSRDLACFLGAGAYNHYIPAVVDAVIRRGEFLTAYTPYQPEVSQGTLQAIFEYQSLVANLTGMDISNASHYDGATATAEACVMAYHQYRGKRSRIILSPSLHPHYRQTAKTYMVGYENLSFCCDMDEDPFITPDELGEHVDRDTALVLVQYPDFFGRIFDLSNLAARVHERGALLAVAVNPTALGILKTPGDMGADIVVGEGQPLGIPLGFGGPYLGIYATRKEHVRRIAGRLVGEARDRQGRRGYVLTLTAREQHIRREKASSNICTNQGLMALAATVYLSALGKHGLRQVAELCYHKAHYAADEINALSGYEVLTDHPFFHEFVVKCPLPVAEVNSHLLDHEILGGYDLGQDYPGLQNHMLLAVTELNNRPEIDQLVEALQELHHD